MFFHCIDENMVVLGFELEAAEKFLKIFKRADLVKFTKNGSSAVTAAVKIARAYNNKKIILRCADHPFFSFDDWFW